MTAPQELLESEPDAFDCSRCERRRLIEGLDDDNCAAWELWLRIGTRAVKDFGLGQFIVTRACEGLAPEDVDDLISRLSVIYDAVCPVTPAQPL